jgi:PAS domain S-box-containing protein
MISANAALPGSYDYNEVARSVFIAIAASYAALDLTGRVTAARGWIRLAWLSGGATAMGIGIWAMQFKGMLAFRLPVSVEYHWPTVLASLLLTIFASAVALYVVSRQRMGLMGALTGSVIMGGGIAGTHYIGIAAMRLPASARFSPLLVAVSVLLAIFFSLIALLMAFDLREETGWAVWRRLGSATVMGVAASVMHYTGMAAASFVPASPPDLSHAVSISLFFNNGIVLITLIVLVAAIVTSSVDRRASAEIRRLNQDLEHRVAERTSQLEALNQALRKEIAERERAQEALRRSEDHLRLVIDTIPQEIWSGPADGSLDFCNTQFRSYTGLAQEESQGDGWLQMLHPDDRERVRKAWRESVTNGTPCEEEVRHRAANGQYRWFLVRGVPLRDSEGHVVRWYGTNTDIEDRKQAEDRLRLVIDTTPAMLQSARPDGYVDFFNQRWLEYVGLSFEDIGGWRWTKVIHPEDVEAVVGQWRSSLATGRPLEAEVRLRRRDGEYRLTLLRKVPLRDQAGSIVKWYGSAIDIEDRKRAEEELRKQKEVFQRIFENIPVMIARVGQGGRHELVNPEWERTIGWTLAEIREQNPDIFAEAFPDPQYRQMVKDVMAASTGEWTDWKVRVRDGRVIDVAATFVRLSDGTNIGIGRNITERKRTEAELRESEARFRLVADSAPVMIWMSGTDKLCTYFNQPWLDFTGRSLGRELGNGWAEGVDPEDLQRCLDTYTQSFDRREAFRVEYRLRRHDGEFRRVLDIGVPRYNPDRSFAGYIGSCIDLTEQRGAEEQLRHAQEDLARVTRVVAMGELAAAIAHEVKQPLTAIVTNGHFCLRELDGATSNPDELRAAIREIVNDGTRASEVISRIRGLLTKGVPDRTDLDINPIIQEVTILLRNEFARHRVSLRTELASDLPRVPGDKVQLQQVLINLIMNGIEATSSSTKGRREILIRSAENAQGVVVQVQDSGLGIEPGLANRVFEPFFTTKAKGIGMGLSISHSIIESHGGRLGIVPSSTGALFEFTLPTDDAGAA